MMIKYILPIVLLCSTCNAETTNTFQVNKPIKQIINTLLEQPVKGNIPDLVYDANVKLNIQVLPRQKKYKVTIDLLEQVKMVTGLHKELLVEEKNGVTIFTSTINIELRRNKFPLRWLNLIKDRILDKVECRVLSIEEKAILDLSGVN